MRVLSLNAWGGAVYEALAQWLPACGADVVCLQEVTMTPGLGGWTRFEDAERTLPQRANLFDDACALLPRHRGQFFASDSGPVVDGDGSEHRQEFGIGIFVGENVPVLAQESAFVHGSFLEHQAWAMADRPRVAHAIRLVNQAADQVVTVAHVHGLRDPRGKGDTPARMAQADALGALVDRVRGVDDFTILCGDLNVLPDSATFDVLAKIGLVDLVGARSTRTSLYSKPIRHANYLLVSEPANVERFDVVDKPEVSDHCPLVLDF